MITYGLAQERDIPALVELGLRFWKLTGMDYAGLDCNPESLRVSLKGMVDSDEQLLVCAWDESGRVVGVLGAFVAAPYFNHDQSIVQETFWYVEPEHRASGVGGTLERMMYTWAKALDATAVVMASVGPREHTQAVDAHYRDQGYKQLEGHWFSAVR